jgi:tRNA threonylcarbamoyladenosine biosynthesis protein TsaB
MDTCTRWLNLALVGREGEVLAQVHEEVQTHTTRLVPALDALFLKTGLTATALAAIGVVLGPGSFTGLRVGLAAAEGLSAAVHAPTFGIDSLTALAEAASGEGEGIALLDARRARVYACRFRRENGRTTALGEPLELDPKVPFPDCWNPAWAVGDGVPLVGAWPDECALQPVIPNLAIPAARVALVRLIAGEAVSPLMPLYVRQPDAKEPGK